MHTLSAKEIGYGVNHSIESVTENWRYFQLSPIFVELIKIFKPVAEGMFICSKLRQNLSELEVRTFLRIRRVI